MPTNGAMRCTLARQVAQPFELSGYPTFTAEIASTAHELLLADMMVERAQTQRRSSSTSAR